MLVIACLKLLHGKKMASVNTVNTSKYSIQQTGGESLVNTSQPRDNLLLIVEVERLEISKFSSASIGLYEDFNAEKHLAIGLSVDYEPPVRDKRLGSGYKLTSSIMCRATASVIESHKIKT